MLSLSLLGPFQAVLGGEPITGFESDKVRALLVYLAVESDQPHTREKLAGLLWPDRPEEVARRNLRHILSNLRKIIGDRQADPPFLQITRQTIQFDFASDYWLDVAAFTVFADQLSSRASFLESTQVSQLEHAAKLYRGPFLDGFSLKGSAAFEEWLLFTRERLQRHMLAILRLLADYYEQQRNYRLACDYAWRQVELEPWQEEAHRRLMRLLALSGRRSEALAQYDTCRRLLVEALGVDPEAETLALYEAIRNGDLSSRVEKQEVEERESKIEDRALPPAYTGLTSGPPFFARERELVQLEKFLEFAMAGQGQVVFVSGEAGNGKTALVQEFARRTQMNYSALMVAGGNCNAYVGIGDPYLPFREIMELLTGDIEAKWTDDIISLRYARARQHIMPHTIQTLIELGSDLIDVFVSGTSLVTRAMAAGYDDASWLWQLKRLVGSKKEGKSRTHLKQTDLFEQYTKVLRNLAQQWPMLLVLDDLQWGDVGSISLLFHLGRRLKSAPILIIGIYRPNDVALGRAGERHPLLPVINEFQRHFGNIRIDLKQTEGKQFINAFLDNDPNRLGDSFREALYQHTQGHALFTIEMVREMQERGDLRQDESGRWVEGPAINWEILPARVEGVIGERISRLPARLQEVLKAASIGGETFIAEVIAQVLSVDESEIVRQLTGEADQRHRLVRSQSSRWLGDQRLSAYHFRHILFQKYLYKSLDEIERVYLHEAIGKILEKIYETETDEVAAQLARHFREAGLTTKATEYLQQAGARAVRFFAYEEAIEQFNQGVTLLKSLPDNFERTQQELKLQLALGTALLVSRGYAAPEIERSFGRARELCLQIGETPQLFPTLHGLILFYLIRGQIQTGQELGEQCLRLALQAQDPNLILEAHRLLAVALFWQGAFKLVQEHAARGIALYDFKQHQVLVNRYGQDPGIVCFIYSALTLWVLGYPDQALDKGRQVLTLARETGNPNIVASILFLSSILSQFCRDRRAVQQQAEEAITLSTEQGFPLWLAGGKITLGWALVEQSLNIRGQDQGREGLVQIQEGLTSWRTAGGKLIVSYFLALLAEAYGKAKQIEEGLAPLTEALEIVNKTGEHVWEAELYRLKGELLLHHEVGKMNDEPNQEMNPEACFLKAIEVARQQSAKSLELRAVVSLCRLWQQQGKLEEASQMLKGIYDWFTEGFDTPDLQEATKVLEELSSNSMISSNLCC